ncbi:hypothetical protein K488DRAFT_75266 [Vararia minispora EC-137]|uniref:Uncharacterized protein n=1 Tax=Vararia minispora EC-137 TaxID=1314806 RepID=A0ACB8Q465_9AGAM|nr:hypothetical protein K488DRAFT_75266 [Vararia minispora EC-137]
MEPAVWLPAQARAWVQVRRQVAIQAHKQAQMASTQSQMQAQVTKTVPPQACMGAEEAGARELVQRRAGLDVGMFGTWKEISGTGGDADEDKMLGDLIIQEEMEYWDSVMWPDEDKISPKDVWLRKVSKPWEVNSPAGGRGKNRKSWLDKHAHIIAEVVHSTMDGPPGMEGTVAYPAKLMDVFNVAATLEASCGFEPVASDIGSTYQEMLPEHLQPDAWKAWQKACFPATLPVAVGAQGASPSSTERRSRQPSGVPYEAINWDSRATRGLGGTFGFVWGLAIWAANLGLINHVWHWNALATDVREVFHVLARKFCQEEAQGGPTGIGMSVTEGACVMRGLASAVSTSGLITAQASICAGNMSGELSAMAQGEDGNVCAQAQAAVLLAEDSAWRVRRESQKLQESKQHAEAIEASKKKRRKVAGNPDVPDPDLNYGHGSGMESMPKYTGERGCATLRENGGAVAPVCGGSWGSIDCQCSGWQGLFNFWTLLHINGLVVKWSDVCGFPRAKTETTGATTSSIRKVVTAAGAGPSVTTGTPDQQTDDWYKDDNAISAQQPPGPSRDDGLDGFRTLLSRTTDDDDTPLDLSSGGLATPVSDSWQKLELAHIFDFGNEEWSRKVSLHPLHNLAMEEKLYELVEFGPEPGGEEGVPLHSHGARTGTEIGLLSDSTADTLLT